METQRRSVIVKSYKLKELALIYRVSCYLMRLMISKHKKSIGKREGYYYQTEQVIKIFSLLKPPSDIDIV